MAFLKPQSPMTKGSDYFYPLTTSDQVIMDGGYRLNEIVGKTKKSTIILYANGWSAEAPYCYSIAIKGLSDKVNMKMLPHFPEDFEDKQLMKEEIAKISFASRENNILTFECWDEIPAIDLLIDIEIDAMYPIKGASIEMNYSVVGGIEQPTKPTKNMIWVNTDQNITNWVFSKSEPKNLEEGMIWFTTGNDSAVSFFTLAMDGKEFDEVYPVSAKQYVNDVWADVLTKSYQNDAWVDWWDGYFFKTGQGAKFGIGFSCETANVTVTIKDDIIAVVQKSTNQSMSRVYTDPIDLTSYSRIYLELVCTVGNADFPGRFAVSKTKPAWQSDSATWERIETLPTSNSIQTGVLDVSMLKGEYYISFGGSVDCDIYNWWLE